MKNQKNNIHSIRCAQKENMWTEGKIKTKQKNVTVFTKRKNIKTDIQTSTWYLMGIILQHQYSTFSRSMTLTKKRKEKKSQTIMISKPPMQLKAIINSIMSRGKMSFPNEKYQIVGKRQMELLRLSKTNECWNKEDLRFILVYGCPQPHYYRCALVN